MSAAAKILSEKPSELELQVAQAFIDLEALSDLKAELRALQFKSIKEIEVQIQLGTQAACNPRGQPRISCLESQAAQAKASARAGEG